MKQVEATPSAERERILAAAYAHNDVLQPGPLTDPYISVSEDEKLRSPKYLAYEELLRLTGTDAIGTVNYPRLGIALTVYHGATYAVISKGVGHMYGTSLPVGGPSTRAVLTSHSGLPNAKLFTRLVDAQVGDQFWISVLGEDHYYEVRSTETVLPGQTESLQIVEGEDWVTLFTCTPIGVNSHRFMVHAQRIDTPSADAGGPGHCRWWANGGVPVVGSALGSRGGLCGLWAGRRWWGGCCSRRPAPAGPLAARSGPGRSRHTISPREIA